MDVHEFAPVGGRATSGRDRRRFERPTQVREDLTLRGRSHPGLLPLANLRFDVSRLLPAVCAVAVMKAISRAMSFAHAIRDVSCERGTSRSISVIRTLASTENPLFSQTSMSAAAAASRAPAG